jgi:RNA polymerase subunit RPABC4/transcription elongation factor Spt4
MLFSGDQLRIADFGLAKVMRHTMISATGSGSLYYAAPEQIHGYPCLASDVFSAGLVVYQMLSGELARWPFAWPFPGERGLRRKVPAGVVRWLRRSVHTDPRQRFADATEMRAALARMEPEIERALSPPAPRRRRRTKKLGAWRHVRFRECQKAFGKPLHLRFACSACAGPVSEHMAFCPWCASQKIRFAQDSRYPAYCPRCGGGMREEWRYCPWCWGPAFSDEPGSVRRDARYDRHCRHCRRPVVSGMRYCPWCHARDNRPVRMDALPDRCPHCKSSVVAAVWDNCPWCGGEL